MTDDRLPPDVHRIGLDNREFEGRNNAYLFAGDGPTTLVDPGVATEAVRDQLVAGMAEHDVALADVDVVVLTHWHSDHAGLAGHVQGVSGAAVFAHEADAPLVAGEGIEEMYDLREARLAEWGVPADKRAEATGGRSRSVGLAGEPVEVDHLADGDRMAAGAEHLRVLHTPGHAAGLVSLAIEGDGSALVGDTVLPVYTPNIGGADLRVERPLDTYRRSLRRLAEAGFERLYPGHRDPIFDPAARIEAILAHHRDRTERTIAVLEERGASTPWEVSQALFGEVSGIHVLHGPGEAFAHLDELVATGAVGREDGRYRLLARPDAADDA